jgi:hypothetical protein
VGGDLYAGGSFTTAGGLTVNSVAHWDSGAWHALGLGMDGTVLALAVDENGDMYAGGWFYSAGGVPVGYVARWDGSAWLTVSGGMDARVYALVLDGSMGEGGSLYAGGFFQQAGGGSAQYVAHWSGNSWSPLGSGVHNTVQALALDGDGNLYAAGWFTQAGGAAANYVARWDGQAWFPLGSGMNDGVYALAVDGNGDLYAGGWFTMAGGVSANRVARWDGSAWHALGTGLDDDVSALVLDGNGDLYAGGFFHNAGVASAERVARWDGSSWSALGGGLESWVQALAIDGSLEAGGNLYAGGWFTWAGGDSANNVARWDGNAWHALGAGTGDSVYALAWDAPAAGGGNLYAGGTFESAGGRPSAYIARWFHPVWTVHLPLVVSGAGP